MTLNLAKLLAHVTEVELSIGRVFIYRLRTTDLGTFSKLSRDASPQDKARTAFAATVSTSTYDPEHNRTPTRLTSEEIASLSPDDEAKLTAALLEPRTFAAIWSESKEALSDHASAAEPAVEQLAKAIDCAVERQLREAQKLRDLVAQSSWGQMQDSIESFRKSQAPIQAQIDAIGRQFKPFDANHFSGLMPSPSVSLNTEPMQRAIEGIRDDAAERRAERTTELSHLEAMAKASVATMDVMANMSSNVAVLMKSFTEAAAKAEASQRRSVHWALRTFIAGLVVSVVGSAFAVMSYLQDMDNNLSNDKWQERVESTLNKQAGTGQEVTELRTKHELLLLKVQALELQVNKPQPATKSPERTNGSKG